MLRFPAVYISYSTWQKSGRNLWRFKKNSSRCQPKRSAWQNHRLVLKIHSKNLSVHKHAAQPFPQSQMLPTITTVMHQLWGLPGGSVRAVGWIFTSLHIHNSSESLKTFLIGQAQGQPLFLLSFWFLIKSSDGSNVGPILQIKKDISVWLWQWHQLNTPMTLVSDGGGALKPMFVAIAVYFHPLLEFFRARFLLDSRVATLIYWWLAAHAYLIDTWDWKVSGSGLS